MPPRWRIHPDTDALRNGLQRCEAHTITFQASIYRVVGYEYANQSDLLTGLGAKLHGARWNPPGQFCVVYGSPNPFAALAESGATAGHYGIPFEKRTPLVMVAIEVTVSRVLDLNDGMVRRRLGVSLERMLDADWEKSQRAGKEALTQAIGRLAYELGWEGLLVPSARLKKEQNLVLFPAAFERTSHLVIINREELPRQRASEAD